MATTNKVKGWTGVLMTEDSSSHWPIKRRHVYSETSRRAGLEFVCILGHDVNAPPEFEEGAAESAPRSPRRRHQPANRRTSRTERILWRKALLGLAYRSASASSAGLREFRQRL